MEGGASGARTRTETISREIARRLLRRSLEPHTTLPKPGTDIIERLKAILPVEQHDWLYRWEPECAENCDQELRKFADYIATMLLDDRVVRHVNEETRDGGESPAGHATAPKRGIHSRRSGFDWDIRT